MTGFEAALASIKVPETARVFENAAIRLAKRLSGPAQSAALKVLASLTSYESYLEETNDRVSTFRSFANPSVPVSLIDHFVSMELTRDRVVPTINQDILIERLHEPSRFVVSATAGHGKSMLMRFIALSMYESPRGRIPLFVELRDLNRVTNPDLITYIHASYKKVGKIGAETLRSGLRSGVFCLILDGFDELNHEIRDIIEGQVLAIARDFSELSIIVSGRPDDKFISWRDFHHYKIIPMSKTHVIELINKLDHDRGTKRRFIQKIKTGLFETHQSFLSTPLLAILMLLTFEENANIPDKMHLFYGKAFETLFHKHDATKEQYDRQRKSALQIDEFSKVFSVFCLNTYVKEKLEFNKSELLGYIRDSVAYTGLSVSADNLLFDLEEAVCLLQKEGFSYFFVHRSFQEYFTALFLSNCPPSVRDDFLDNVSFRYWDNVLSMLFDMSADQMEPSWIKKNIDDYLLGIEQEGGTEFSKLKSRFSAIVSVKNNKSAKEEVSHMLTGPGANFIHAMQRFYRGEFESDHEAYRGSDRLVAALSKRRAPNSTRVMEHGDLEDSFTFKEFEFEERDLSLPAMKVLMGFVNRDLETLKKIRSDISDSQTHRMNFLDRLFAQKRDN